ncbi:uncharacterized protein METZ01_LOCUS193730 [marine metagenome]|uniref:Uncharacterized protein n=1 Tax=marine metagenome TaxID=408172 RepID=A0A382DQV0_9ZZZZ
MVLPGLTQDCPAGRQLARLGTNGKDARSFDDVVDLVVVVVTVQRL